MQGIVRISRAYCPAKLHHHVPYSCPAARVSRSLCYGSKQCGTATGERARAVAVRRSAGTRAGGPGTGEEEHAPAPQPDAVVASSGGTKRGSVAGAVALIVGTSIGSGILAVPQRTAPAVSSFLSLSTFREVHESIVPIEKFRSHKIFTIL